MLFSAVDACSGVVYQEYRSVYGEDAESALRFLFNAFAAKPEPELPFQGLPVTIYMDNGPVSRSRVFQSVMGSLGVRVLTHLPPKADDRSEEHTSELQSLMRISYAVFCLKKKITKKTKVKKKIYVWICRQSAQLAYYTQHQRLKNCTQ